MIALYKGKSLLSRGIQLRTWSEYSHAAWVLADGSVIEAWTNGVRHVANLSVAHTPGTVVDIFSVTGIDNTPGEYRGRVAYFLTEQLGKSYDFAGILGFMERKERQQKDRWFCSELVFAACQQAGVDLLARVPAWKVDPGMLALSPLLVLDRTIVT